MKKIEEKTIDEVIENLKSIEVCGTKYQMYYDELINRIEKELKK